MSEYLEKMKDQLDCVEQSKVRGLSTRDVIAQTYCEAGLRKLAENLKSPSSFGDAAFRLHSFIYERQDGRVPEDIRRQAANNVAEDVKGMSKNIDEGAVHIFLAWGASHPDYRSIGLQLFRHPGSWIRRIAVSYSGAFLRQNEYSKLIEFRSDLESAETGGMGGPLRFLLRDHALGVLKRLTESPVVEDDCFEDRPEGRVFYRSWTPFLDWFERRKAH